MPKKTPEVSERPTNFRVCPRCSKQWLDEKDWERETELVGPETRDLGVTADVRRHRCGGEMYSSGTPMVRR